MSKPAFPTKHPTLDPRASGFHTEEGMTLRDYFAAKAMQAIIAKRPWEPDLPAGVNESDNMVATGAYDYADAMLAARDRKEEA